MKEHFVRFKNPAHFFEEAMPLGNGTLGATVYGGYREDTISLNHCHLWSGEPHSHKNPKAVDAYHRAQELVREGKLYEAEELLAAEFVSDWSECFLPLGKITVGLPNRMTSRYTRQLDISRGLAEVSYGGDSTQFSHRHFVSFPDRVLASRYENRIPGDFLVSFSSGIRPKITAEGDTIVIRGRCPYRQLPGYYVDPDGYNELYDPHRGNPFTAAVKVTTDGVISTENNALRIEYAKWITLYVSCFTGFVAPDRLPEAPHEKPCLDTVRQAAELGFDALLERHLADFTSLFDRVALDLQGAQSELSAEERLAAEEPDFPSLTELLFNFGRYLLISSSREGSAANLQGIWNEYLYAPWSANYTVNINTEMNYWPAMTANLAECARPFEELAESVHRAGRETAKEFYGAPGFVSHHNCDLWAHTEPVGKGDPHSCVFAFWNMSSGWMACQLYDQYEYAPDREKLKNRVYPVLRDAALFYLSQLIPDEEGQLILSPATSPENSFRLDGKKRCGVARWSAMSQEIVKKLFLDCIACCEELGEDGEFSDQLKQALPRIRIPFVAGDGSLCEWDRDYIQAEPQHRHVSHLWALYPGELFRRERDPELVKACEKTLEIRGDDGTGWSLAWKINLFTALGDGNHAMRLLKNQLRLCSPAQRKTLLTGGGTYPNLLDAHPPFQIDGNFGAVSGVASMLLQSDRNTVRILPALPDCLKSGSVRGLKAKNNVTCDIVWEDSRLKKLKLQCETPVSFTLITPDQSQEVSLIPGIPIIFVKEE